MGELQVAAALKARGRGDDVRKLLGCVKKKVAEQSRGPIRSFFYPKFALAALSAQILAVEGNRAAAFREMDRALRLGATTPHSTGLAIYGAFDEYRSTSEYRELDARFKHKAAIERQQVLQQQRRT